MGAPGRLIGRRTECAALDQLLTDALAGQSRVVVLRGEAGVGKTALLCYLLERVAGWHVMTADVVESGMELAYAGLNCLCAPLVDRLDRLPGPQRDALATVFGRSTGPPPDRFLVGLATLTLLADVAEQQPLVCVVDDAHWLDEASAQILGFVARRLAVERIVLVCAARTGSGNPVLRGLPELFVSGLSEADARALLLRHVHGPLDAAVCQQIIRESHGNPLALLELPRTWTVAELAGGFGVLDGQPVAGKIERSYAERLDALPRDSRLLVLAAAAEPLGDPDLLRRAAETLGADMAAVEPAVDTGLIEMGARIEFAHPLVRSAAYRNATPEDRQRVHRALADATDGEIDPDRRAWHRAHATGGAEESVALELEQSATRAQARGGAAAAAAFLQHALTMTADPARRADRALAAAQASLEAGAFDAALAALATAEDHSLDEFQRARTHLLRGRIASASSFGSAAAELLTAGRELETLDVDLARATYLEAWANALAAGQLAAVGTLRHVSRAGRNAPPPAHVPSPSDLLLDGLARLVTDGLSAAKPLLRQAVSGFRDDDSVLQWGTMAATAAAALWDMEAFEAVITRQVRLAREAGAVALLATALQGAGIVATWCGDFRRAEVLVAEADAVTSATGVRISPYGGMLLAALRGREEEASAVLGATLEAAPSSGEGLGVQYAHWATAIVANGLGRYEEALIAARRASDDTPELFVADWALVELVEAAVRTGNRVLAAEASDRLADAARASASDWALGVSARSRALTSEGTKAEELYIEAVERLRRTDVRPELARAHLLFGEWLRLEGRRVDARDQLRTAHEMLAAIGMEAFASRARRELIAIGQKVRKAGAETRERLTPQEEQIARLVRDGLSNPEIGAMLFLSPRTIEWHLRKVFTKLGVSSRRELRNAVPDGHESLAGL